MIASAAEWATTSGPPNWLFVAAILTHPKTWSELLLSVAVERLGGNERPDNETNSNGLDRCQNSTGKGDG